MMRDQCQTEDCTRWAVVITRDANDFVIYLCAQCARKAMGGNNG